MNNEQHARILARLERLELIVDGIAFRQPVVQQETLLRDFVLYSDLKVSCFETLDTRINRISQALLNHHPDYT